MNVFWMDECLTYWCQVNRQCCPPFLAIWVWIWRYSLWWTADEIADGIEVDRRNKIRHPGFWRGALSRRQVSQKTFLPACQKSDQFKTWVKNDAKSEQALALALTKSFSEQWRNDVLSNGDVKWPPYAIWRREMTAFWAMATFKQTAFLAMATCIEGAFCVTVNSSQERLRRIGMKCFILLCFLLLYCWPWLRSSPDYG